MLSAILRLSMEAVKIIVDLDHDAVNLDHKISCPVLALLLLRSTHFVQRAEIYYE
jgi:hypothetical protein